MPSHALIKDNLEALNLTYLVTGLIRVPDQFQYSLRCPVGRMATQTLVYFQIVVGNLLPLSHIIQQRQQGTAEVLRLALVL